MVLYTGELIPPWKKGKRSCLCWGGMSSSWQLLVRKTFWQLRRSSKPLRGSTSLSKREDQIMVEAAAICCCGCFLRVEMCRYVPFCRRVSAWLLTLCRHIPPRFVFRGGPFKKKRELHGKLLERTFDELMITQSGRKVRIPLALVDQVRLPPALVEAGDVNPWFRRFITRLTQPRTVEHSGQNRDARGHPTNTLSLLYPSMGQSSVEGGYGASMLLCGVKVPCDRGSLRSAVICVVPWSWYLSSLLLHIFRAPWSSRTLGQARRLVWSICYRFHRTVTFCMCRNHQDYVASCASLTP